MVWVLGRAPAEKKDHLQPLTSYGNLDIDITIQRHARIGQLGLNLRFLFVCLSVKISIITELIFIKGSLIKRRGWFQAVLYQY